MTAGGIRFGLWLTLCTIEDFIYLFFNLFISVGATVSESFV